jgi:hypothetical protein
MGKVFEDNAREITIVSALENIEKEKPKELVFRN